MADRNAVIAVALAEVGYLEKASNANLDDKTANAGDANFTKYARDLYKVTGFYNGNKQGAAWCDVFVDWCFVKAYGATAARKLLCQPTKSSGAGVKYSAQYYKDKGQYFDDVPHSGDQIFFGSNGSYTHTGIVYSVSGTTVYTVEGNTSAGSAVIANGGAVCKKKYSTSNARIMGYGRPNYDGVTAVTPSTTTDTITAEAGSTSTETAITYTTYTVKKGDTLWGIAQKYLGKGIRYKEIMTLNGLKSTVIRPGKVLKIPSK